MSAQSMPYLTLTSNLRVYPHQKVSSRPVHGLYHYTPVLPKSRHTLKMMVSGLFVEFELTVNHIYDIILNTVTMRT